MGNCDKTRSSVAPDKTNEPFLRKSLKSFFSVITLLSITKFRIFAVLNSFANII